MSDPEKYYPLSDTDRCAIYDHLGVVSGEMATAKNHLRTADERLNAIAEIINKMVPPLK